MLLIMARNGSYTNEEDAYSLKFTASPRELIINKFRIYNIWHVQRIKNSCYYSATTGIRTSYLPYSMTLSKGYQALTHGAIEAVHFIRHQFVLRGTSRIVKRICLLHSEFPLICPIKGSFCMQMIISDNGRIERQQYKY